MSRHQGGPHHQEGSWSLASSGGNTFNHPWWPVPMHGLGNLSEGEWGSLVHHGWLLVAIAMEPLGSPSACILLGLKPSYSCCSNNYCGNTAQYLDHGGQVSEDPLAWMSVSASILKVPRPRLPLLWMKVLATLWPMGAPSHSLQILVGVWRVEWWALSDEVQLPQGEWPAQ